MASLVARLRNLTLVRTDSGKKEVAVRRPAAGEDSTSTEFPALDLAVDELTWKDKQLGKMELLARQHGRDWLLEHMRITNPDGVVDCGWEVPHGERQDADAG